MYTGPVCPLAGNKQLKEWLPQQPAVAEQAHWAENVNYKAIMMRSDMTTSRRGGAENGEVTGKNLSMYTTSNCHADDFNFQLHDINREVIGTALS